MQFQRSHKVISTNSEQALDEDTLITDSQRIIHILYKVVREHRQLEARITGISDVFNTTILGLNPKTKIIAVDGIRNSAGHNALLRTKILNLSGRNDGVDLECDLHLISVKEHSNSNYYQMAIPNSLVYVQRRNDHRVQLVGESQFRGYLEHKKKKLVTGYAADISLNGIGVMLKLEDDIMQGDKITSCALKLPDEKPLYFDLIVCFVQKIHRNNSVRIGGQFLKLEKKENIRVAKIVRTLERKQAQMVRT